MSFSLWPKGSSSILAFSTWSTLSMGKLRPYQEAAVKPGSPDLDGLLIQFMGHRKAPAPFLKKRDPADMIDMAMG